MALQNATFALPGALAGMATLGDFVTGFMKVSWRPRSPWTKCAVCTL